MNYIISLRIAGVPYTKGPMKAGRLKGLPVWTEKIVQETTGLPRITGPCSLRVTFFLPPDKFPADCPCGSDLDNLLKPFLDALGKTVFSEAPGGDSCITSLQAFKVRVDTTDNAGVALEIRPDEEWSETRRIFRRSKPHLAIEGNHIFIESESWVVPTTNQSLIDKLAPELTSRLGKLTTKYPKARDDVRRFVESVERLLA